MSSRGLPGFLRRSRRWNDFEDDDNDDHDEVLENGNDNKDTKKQQQQQQQQQQKQSQGQQQQQQQLNNEPSRLLSASLQFLDPSSLAASSAQEDIDAGCTNVTTPLYHGDDSHHDDANPNNDSQSLSTIGDYDPTVVDTPPQKLWNNNPISREISDGSYTSKSGYREAQFEKILSNNVVKLSDLRKIGWNGIPVRWFFVLSVFVCCVFYVFICPNVDVAVDD
jgi:hypothetical protein